jgi:hypothetical protein
LVPAFLIHKQLTNLAKSVSVPNCSQIASAYVSEGEQVVLHQMAQILVKGSVWSLGAIDNGGSAAPRRRDLTVGYTQSHHGSVSNKGGQ